MHCTICGCLVTEGPVVACDRCGTPFHKDCWEFNEGCAVYGCGTTTCRAWQPPVPVDGGVMVIAEGTKPPFRLAPVVEAAVRRLPRWGRSLVPLVVIGLGGAAAVIGVGSWVFGSLPHPQGMLTLAGICIACSLLAGLMADVLRRWPLTVAALSYGLGALVMNLTEAPGEPGRTLVFGSFLVSLVLGSLGLVEAVLGRRWVRAVFSPAVRGLGRGLATMGVLVLIFLGLQVYNGGRLSGLFSTRHLAEAVVFALMGLSVTAPPLALSSSALMHRLKAEAAREAEDEA